MGRMTMPIRARHKLLTVLNQFVLKQDKEKKKKPRSTVKQLKESSSIKMKF